MSKELLPTFSNAARAFTLYTLFSLHSQWAYAQLDPVLQSVCSTHAVKSLTAYQRNFYQGKADSAEFKAAYYEFNKAGQLTMERTFSAQPQLIKQYKASYNSYGQLVKEVWKERYTDSVVYRYNDLGLCSEERWYWGLDKTKDRKMHQYDSTGKLQCTISAYTYGSVTDSIFYDNDTLVLMRSYDESDESGFQLLNTIYIYDAKGRQVVEEKTDNKGKLLQRIKKEYYDSGLLKSITTSYYSGNQDQVAIYGQQTEIFRYEKSKMSERTVSSTNNGEKLIHYEVLYDYDDDGMMTHMETNNFLTKEKSIFRYIYTYQPQ
ncbi:MAG: hypothetical protein SFW35_01805 [Chitinophagales bacterium]|nr:hypothetical protein [Chitinophagales bacterium]